MLPTSTQEGTTSNFGCPDRIFIVFLGPSRQVKSKAIPLKACTGREGYRILRLSDFKTIVT